MEMCDLIKEVEERDARINELKELFYPDIHKLELADQNLTKCLKGLK